MRGTLGHVLGPSPASWTACAGTTSGKEDGACGPTTASAATDSSTAGAVEVDPLPVAPQATADAVSAVDGGHDGDLETDEDDAVARAFALDA
jgi:hypothetical protein